MTGRSGHRIRRFYGREGGLARALLAWVGKVNAVFGAREV